jgi:hypothetical protein
MARPKQSESGISKMEAVRQAVLNLGREAPLVDVIRFIKKNFKMEIPRAMAYTYKSVALKETAGGGRGRGRKPGRKPAAVNTVTLDDIRAVKALADRIGAEKVKQLAGVLA